MEKFKYINNISSDTAEIRIYKRIGSTRDAQGNYVDGVNGADFANEMAYLQNSGVSKINVRINSGGGSVMDAMAIQASILNSKISCDTYNDGIAASAAASILVSGHKSYMADNAIFMVHNGIDESGTVGKKVMDVFNESIATLLTNRTGKTGEEITAMMSKETWLNAKQCVENKIVDEIVSTGKKMKTPKVTNAFEMERIYNEFLINPTNMKNIVATLKLGTEATEMDVVNAISTKDAKITELTNEITALKKEKTDAEVADKAALLTEVTNYATKLVTDKKIKEDAKSALIANASKDKDSFEFIKNIYDNISTVKEAKKIFDVTAIAKDGTNRSTWTYRDWETKDSKGLAEMQNTAPDQFTELYNAFYKK